MKKLQDNLAARIAASVILTVSFLLTLLSTAGIVLLASYQAYNDGGAQLRTSYLHAAGVQEYYDHVEPVLEGLVHEPQSYQNYLNSLNVHVDVKTTDGRQMLRPDIRERHVAARCGSRGQIRRRLHAVRQDRVACAGERNAAADAQQAPLAADVCTAGAQEDDQVSDLRLTRGVAQRQCSPAAERRKNQILRCADAWKRQCDRAAVKAVGPGRNMLAVKRDLRTHPAQAAQVQIDRPRAEHAAAGQAQLRHAEVSAETSCGSNSRPFSPSSMR